MVKELVVLPFLLFCGVTAEVLLLSVMFTGMAGRLGMFTMLVSLVPFMSLWGKSVMFVVVSPATTDAKTISKIKERRKVDP